MPLNVERHVTIINIVEPLRRYKTTYAADYVHEHGDELRVTLTLRRCAMPHIMNAGDG